VPLAAQTQDNAVHINEIQVNGTHNSYHAGISPGEAKLWPAKAPALYSRLDYRHPSLTAQLRAGVRQLEVDIFAAEKGGPLYPPGRARLGGTGRTTGRSGFRPRITSQQRHPPARCRAPERGANPQHGFSGLGTGRHGLCGWVVRRTHITARCNLVVLPKGCRDALLYLP
jgi:hypothetical protein